tara:strand:+ start:968 stop:1198 length:231 start_codon:yes stop_codon:yes gene_type:complete
MESKNTVQSVASDLEKHEAKCEERWKTIFRETSEIKEEVSDLHKTLRMAVFGCFGFLGTLLITVVGTLIAGLIPLN